MSAIEWTDETWNPIVGCSVVSPGCTNCYAMRLAGGRLRHHPTYEGLTEPSKAGPAWNGKVAFVERAVAQPLHWRKPRRIFVNSMGDLFHESVSFETIDRVWAVMALCPHLTFQVLTKRPERAREYLTLARHRFGSDLVGSFEMVRGAMLDGWPELTRSKDHPHGANGMPWPLPNVWLGTSVEDQARAEQRIPLLIETPAAVRFLSCEPLLGQVNLHWIALRGTNGLDALAGEIEERETGKIRSAAKLDWIISGGESGPGARPMHPDWIRSIRDQCQAAGTAFFFKQWGEHEPIVAADSMAEHVYYEADTEDLRDSATRCQVVWPDGRRLTPEASADWWLNQDFDSDGDTSQMTGCPVIMRRTGKKAAGRTLDGATWDQMPDDR